MKQAPDFDLTFSELKAGDSAPDGNILDLAVSDDELPDTHEILTAFDHKKGHKKPARSSETHYSDPDIDDFIVNAPSLVQSARKSISRALATGEEVQDLTISSHSFTQPYTCKRARDGEDLARAVKRQRELAEERCSSLPKKVRTRYFCEGMTRSHACALCRLSQCSGEYHLTLAKMRKSMN
jgi:hypothetical protein